MGAQVVVRDLRKRYGKTEALRSVSLDIEAGGIFGLLGPNGAGKSTLVECLIGLREPDGGSIEICGIDARRNPRGVREKIGAALQTTALQDLITPREALTLFGSFYRQRTTADVLLKRFALTAKADAPFNSLSGGQRQRLALALAFVNQPELVLLDEPTAGLDPQSRQELHEEIVQMKRDGHTVLITTHQLDEAEQLCDRVAIIDRGQIIASGSPRELIAGQESVQTVDFETNRPLDPAELASLPGVQDLVCDGARGQFRTAQATRTIAALTALLSGRGIELVDLHVHRGTLEELFLRLTGPEAGS